MAAKDYKHSGRGRKPQPLAGWVWMLSGLAIGLFVALLVYLSDRPPGPITPPSLSVAAPEPRPPRSDPAAPEPAEAPPKPRFDFYTLLPELEVVIPEGDYRIEDDPGPAPAPVEAPGSYMLQAGSFRQFPEADRMKASLALLGVQARIQTVQVNDDTWHRVRVGPYNDLGELNEIRDRLRDNAIDTILVKAR
ncbi:MAG: SPOR domain-containing protein [Chromatiales bacterium]